MSVKKVSGFGDVPDLQPRTFRIMRGDEALEFDWKPLTFEKLEEVRVRIPNAVPPMKKLQLGAAQLVQRAERGLPTEYPDDNDPAYLQKQIETDNARAMERLRLALGWDVPSEEFAVKARSVFLKGELDAFVDEIDKESQTFNPQLVARFLESMNRSQPTDAVSLDTGTS